MKKTTRQFLIILQVLILLTSICEAPLYAAPSPSGVQDVSISIKNVSQTSDRVLEFDIFLLDTDASQPFELASVQCGITVNPAIYTGGTISASIIAGSSGLNALQTPVKITYTTGIGANVIKLSAATPPGAGSGTILSSVAPGTRIARIRLTSTVSFPNGSTANLAFASSTAMVPSYATRIATYITGINTQLTVILGTNAFVLENPLLNPLLPIAFTVTGGGTCCDNTPGLPVGLNSSQAGTTYRLYRNDVQAGAAVTGTGTAFTFPGNQTAGAYTVTGTNANGTSQMLNSVMVLMNPSPIAAFTTNNPICSGSALILTGSPPSMTSYAWSGPNGFTSALQNPSIPAVTTLATGNYSITVTNTYGCVSSTSNTVIVNVPPVPAIAGTTSVCAGSAGVPYTTQASMTAYTWVVTGGTISSGAGTNSITVDWGPVGTGSVSVNYTSPNNCSAAQPTVLNTTISPMPPTQRILTNITIANGQDFCYDATRNIYVAGSGSSFVVAPGGNTHMVAGQSVFLYPGTRVQNGGRLHAYSANDCLYCTMTKSASIISEPDSSESEPNQTGAVADDFFRVYPNPTTGLVTLKLSGDSKATHATVEVYGMQGVCIIKSKCSGNQCSVDLARYPSGIYYLKVLRNDIIRTVKIIKL